MSSKDTIRQPVLPAVFDRIFQAPEKEKRRVGLYPICRKLVLGAFTAVYSGLSVSRVNVMLRNGKSLRTSHFLDEQRERDLQ
jgi:hypothetical protein